MIFLDELRNLVLYKTKFHLPINEKDKRRGSAIILLTPNIQSSISTINSSLFLNRYHHSYYIERTITSLIENDILSESINPLLRNNYNQFIDLESKLIGCFEADDAEKAINEATLNYNNQIRKIVYKERLRRPDDIITIFDEVKNTCPEIKETYITYGRYKSFNMFYDIYYYNELFFKNNTYQNDRGVDLYLEYLSRLINDPRLKQHGYTKRSVFIPVNDWGHAIGDAHIGKYNESTNPISMFHRIMMKDEVSRLIKVWKDVTFVFMGENKYFKVDVNELDKSNAAKFLSLSNILVNDTTEIQDDGIEGDSVKSKVYDTVDKIEKSTKVTINNLTGTGDESADKLIKKIEDASARSGLKDTSDDIIDSIDKDEEAARLLQDAIDNNDSSTVDRSAARNKRITELANKIDSISINGKSVKSILQSSSIPELPKEDLSDRIATVSKDKWNNLTAINFDKTYDIEANTINVFKEFAAPDKQFPLSITDIKKEDTSTSEDFIDTYTVSIEDVNGKRSSFKIDIPQYVDDKFLMLKGNMKSINSQIYLLPISKTAIDTVQIVSLYNKIFIKRFGNKAYPVSDTFIKRVNTIKDLKNARLKVTVGDCEKANSKYGVNIDYNEICKEFVRIENNKIAFYFNQDEIRKLYDIDESKGFPYGYNKITKEVLYYKETSDVSISSLIDIQLSETLTGEVADTFNKTKSSTKKYAFSRAKIMTKEVPLIVVLSYSIGLFKVLDRAHVEYRVTEKRERTSASTDIIKFADGYLIYTVTPESSLLINGIKQCNTEDYSIKDLNSKSTYLDWLDLFGGRIMADGIENFYELMIDFRTKRALEYYNLPTDYVGCMLYANNLLSDTSVVDHTYMGGRRIRSKEIVTDITYRSLSRAYAQYKRGMKSNKKDIKFTVDQNAVIKELLELPTVSDNSTSTAILEAETLSTISYQGPSGLNSNRAYNLEKRAYDESMKNILAMSTIVSASAGINRVMTIDSAIESDMGFLKMCKNDKEMSTSKSFSFAEAMTPFGPTRDDPPRTAMASTQNKHTVRVKGASPLLVTNGADQALPYFLSNTFAFKSKQEGKVLSLTDKYMILEYKDGTKEFVDLRANNKKNSSAGSYVSVKLDTDLKEGSRFKANEIVAYDRLSFSKKVGLDNNVGYSQGVFVKMAMLNTDEGYEDSSIISEKLSELASTEVVLKKEVIVNKNDGIFKIAKKGDAISEGDPLAIIQSSFEEEDVNQLLRSMIGDEEEINELGRKVIKSHVTGVLEDIRVYKTVPTSELSPSLKKAVNEIEKPIKELHKVMAEYDMEYAKKFIESVEVSEPTGKLKNVDDGVLFEFYQKYTNKLGIADKMSYFVALKGVVRGIFPKGQEPTSEFRPNEKIDTILALASTQSRMTFSIKIHMKLNLLLVELCRSIMDILEIDYDAKN